MQTLTDNQTLPYVVFTLKDSVFAISSEHVLNIQRLEEITPMPDMAPGYRGIILFNNESVPVYDLKKAFGVPDVIVELEETMESGIKDHRDWVHELEQSVEEGREFTRTTDPHACALGRWYDALETDNSYLRMYMNQVDAPHRAIHQTGDTVQQLMQEGKKEEARAAIKEMKQQHFTRTIDILSGAAEAIEENTHEMLIILTIEDELKSIVVDRVTNIKRLNNLCEAPGYGGQNRQVTALATEEIADDESVTIQILNINHFW